MPELWYPEAKHLVLPEAESQDRIVPRLGIAHSQGGFGSLFNFWLNGSSLESHMWFGVAGEIEQYMPFNVQADANRWANDFAVSFETENHPEHVRARSWNLDPWSEVQVANITRFCAWLHTEWDIPAELTPTWDGSGFGWHIMFGSPGPWTPIAKACPGQRRIEQFRRIVVPALTGVYNDGMPYTDADGLKIIAGVEAILADNFDAVVEEVVSRVNVDITNATNRAINTLGKGFDPAIVSTLPNKSKP